MTEARYRGQKVVVVSPDFAGHTKFADHWLPAQAGSDGALAMAMGHVILKEFYVDRQVPYFERYARENTDLPFLVTLERARRRHRRRPLPACVRPRRRGRERRLEDGRLRHGDGRRRRPERLDRLPLGRRGHGQVEPRARRDRACADAARPPRRAGRGRAAALRRGRLRGRRLASPRRAREDGRRHSSSRPSSTCSPPSSASAAATCPATGRPATTTRSRTRRPGRRSTPASTPAS